MNKQTDLLRRYWFAVAFALLAGAVALVFNFRDELADYLGYSANKETAGVLSASGLFVRDALLFLGAVTGIVIALWRNYLLDKQNQAAIDNARAAAENADIANDRLHSDQLVSAAELMAKDTHNGQPAISARIDGINILRNLAAHPEKGEEFAPRMIHSLMAYIKINAQRLKDKNMEKLREKFISLINNEVARLDEDVKIAFSVLEEILEQHAAKLLKNGKISIKKDLSFFQQDFSHLNLSGKTIPKWGRYFWKGAKFAGADMRYANMEKAAFQEADMRGVKLNNAILRKANFVCAQLQAADFSPSRIKLNRNQDGGAEYATDMSNAILKGASMQGANLYGAILDDAELSNANLVGANFYIARLRGTKFFSTEGTGTTFCATNFRKAETNSETHFPYVKEVDSRIWRNHQNGDSPPPPQLCKFGEKPCSKNRLDLINEQECKELKGVLKVAADSDLCAFQGIIRNLQCKDSFTKKIIEAAEQAKKELCLEGNWPSFILPPYDAGGVAQLGNIEGIMKKVKKHARNN